MFAAMKIHVSELTTTLLDNSFTTQKRGTIVVKVN